jgi:PAS domain S-box-containing protein
MTAHARGRAGRDPEDFLAGGGEMGTLIRSLDWSTTPLGPVERWPQSLRSAVSILLPSKAQIVLFWGPHLVALYNDAYRPVFGAKHPWALGQPARDCWREVWDVLEPLFQGVMRTGEAFWARDHRFYLERHGYPEETYFDVSYDPVRDESGGVGGVFCIVSETTGRVLGERRLATLRELGAATALESEDDVFRQTAAVLAQNPADVPFALLFLLDKSGQFARLVDATGVAREALQEVTEVDLTSPTGASAALRSRTVAEVLPEAFVASLPLTASGERVLVLPLVSEAQPAGFLVAGVSRHLALTGHYRGFFDLVADRVAAAIGGVRAYKEQRLRAEALAELDRAKTVFFSNVSHEFRTPLTLMLGPLEDLLIDARPSLAPEHRAQLETAHRNSLRLLKLVNTLLDFSRIEAGRVQAVYEPTELDSFTAELASNFRAAIEKAGLRFLVNCASTAPVYVDRDMWEKIVLNLLSNAFKFTLEGEIEVRLQPVDGERVELIVRDTGVGIPAEEKPHLFERFHRARGASGRTQEGTGIGLALVQELVKLHGGTIQVDSAPDQGSTFTISMPTGTAHLPADRIGGARIGQSTAFGAQPYVEEALRWLPFDDPSPPPAYTTGLDAATPHASRPSQRGAGEDDSHRRPRILCADDNADMREYIRRLLSPLYDVEVVADGQGALDRIHANPPDMVLADVMMPRLDGFGLLRAIRADTKTRSLPIVMLSARAEEDARVEGLDVGADAYLTKPFSARELLARVSALLELAAVRREAERALRLRSEQFKTLLDRAPLGVYLVDADFRIREVNPIARSLFCDIPGGVVDRDFAEITRILWGKQYADETVRIFRHTLDTGEPYVTPERAQLRIDRGTSEYYEWRLDRIILADGRYGVVCYFRDISTHVQARKALEESRETLRDADRRKDEFLATLSHELRTPLTSILGWVRMLKQGQLSLEQAARAVDVIERNTIAQARLIDDLLDVSRIVTGQLHLEFRPVDLTAVIETSTETVRQEAKNKGVELLWALDPSAGPVWGDQARLVQAVVNLLTNAVKFTPSGGRVTIGLVRVDPYAVLTVTDTGTGIDPVHLPHVFERFRQADSRVSRRHTGLGLGLSIVRSIVESHKGSVTASSEGVNRGATFTLTLPLMAIRVDPTHGDEQSAPGKVAIKADEAKALKGLRVLVVDDEADARDLVSLVLEQAGSRVERAGSVAVALETLERLWPDIIVTDIAMPGADGYELIARVRKLEPHRERGVPIMAVTAYAAKEDRNRALAAGFEAYLVKPVDRLDLVRTVSRLVTNGPRQSL